MEQERRAALKRTERAKKEDEILNRILIWFGGAVAAELVLLWLSRCYEVHSTASSAIMLAYYLHKIFPILTWVFLALTVACGVWLFTARRGGKKGRLPLALTILFGVCFLITAAAVLFSESGIQMLCRVVMGVTVLALVYYLYQKEFFCATLVAAGGLLALWVLRRVSAPEHPVVYVGVVVLAVLIVAVALGCRTLQKNDGVWRQGGKEWRLFPKKAAYLMVYLSCLVTAAAVIGALAGGAAAAYYLLFALVAWLFIMAVYFTVKLM